MKTALSLAILLSGVVPTACAGDIPAPEWIAFGDCRQKRVLFLLHHQDDDYPEYLHLWRNNAKGE